MASWDDDSDLTLAVSYRLSETFDRDADRTGFTLVHIAMFFSQKTSDCYLLSIISIGRHLQAERQLGDFGCQVIRRPIAGYS